MTHSPETEETPEPELGHRARESAESRRWEELMSMLNHELRNPLAPIRTALQLMALRGPQQFPREREVIQRQVARLVRVLDGLSDGARPRQVVEAGGAPEAADSLRVLIVDDNVDAAQMLAWLLEELGCCTEVAYDGRTAIELAREFEPQLALLDINLPEMDGYELATHLREELDGVRLVAVTAYGQPSDRRRSRQAGFEAHLVKPLDVNELAPLLHS